ncbi:MAG: flagellar motor protein MotB [SAR324 cluster bacterium]|nr:flagellar motor protein MotB [SAR324 cluster bacterium]
MYRCRKDFHSSDIDQTAQESASLQEFESVYQKPRGDGNTVMFTSLSLILLAFFILLFALSSPKSKDKQLELAFEIQKAFKSMGGLFGDIGDSIEVGRGTNEQTLEVSSQVESLLSELSSFTEKEEDLEDFSYEVNSEEFKLEIPSDFTFEPGSAQINPRAEPFLEKIFEMIVRTENKLKIEGHTDDLPSRNALFDSNWELSAARAMNVLRFFTDKKVVPESRFSAVGYGRYRPVSSNRLSSGRAKNRRITITFIGTVKPLGGPLGTGK